MNINSVTNDVFAPRDIRRYPSELGHVPSRNAAQNPEIGRQLAYSEVVASVDSTKGANGDVTAATEPSAMPNAKPFSLWEKESFGFGDLIDIINPLQHIPIVATFYRNLSGDQIGPAPRVIGGAIWGRIGGLVSGFVNAVVEWWSGKDIGDHIYAAIFGDPKTVDRATTVAQKNAPSSVATRQAPAPQSAETANAVSAESPSAVAPENDAVGPAALLSEPFPTLPRATRAALISYKKNRDRGEADESFRIRLPA